MDYKKEYIERGAFDRELQNLVRECNKNCESDKSSGAFEALHRLRLAPAADVVEVVHGEWIPDPIMSRNPYARNYNCSVCGNSPIEVGNYCPHCGAKMDGGKE